MPKLIFGSTRDADMHYAVKIPLTSSFFYLDTGKKKIAFLGKTDFGLLSSSPARGEVSRPLRRDGGVGAIEEIPLESFLPATKKIRSKASERNKLAYVILKKYKLLGRNIEVPIHFPLDMADFLRKYGAKLTPTFPFFPKRAVKTEEEIEFIKASHEHTKLAFRAIEGIIRDSIIRGNRIFYRGKILTSEFLKQEAEKAFIEKGMFDLLGMIVSTGGQTAIPHHSGSGPIRPHEPIVCDIFPRHRQSGYFSDMTRTYVKGKPSPEILKMHKTVFMAQIAALKKIRPGVKASTIFASAEKVILGAGYEPFIHGLGHGIGLDIHEKPSIKRDSEDILRAGNVITIEPGLYYPKIGGIRIEDLVLVTKKGYINLTNYPRKLIIP